MNEDSPPRGLAEPEILDRRNERPRPIKSSAAAIAGRAEKARLLRDELRPIERKLHGLTEAQRRAFFVKLRHSGPVPLGGTGLKAVSPPSDHVTLAVPRDVSLTRLESKLSEYGADPVRKGVIPNSQLVGRLQHIEEGTPLDRLSDDLLERYREHIQAEWIVVELELTSQRVGRRQQRADIASLLEQLNRHLGPGVSGSVFEHEEDRGSCRVIIGCTGAAFQALVELPEWQTTITWFELPPQFDTFHTILREFTVANLADFESPATNDGIVCIVDSGILPGNPFLQPVTRVDLMRSFLKGRDADVIDQHGHGSAVGSIASYYALNLAAGAANIGRVWLASARILDENNDLPDRLLSRVLEEVVATFRPLGVRIFNLSVNLRNRPWNSGTRRLYPKRTWTARTIDRLSRTEGVVFVVSAGNLNIATVRTLAAEKPYPTYFNQNTCSILDPAEAALAITVGSLAPTTQVVGAVGRTTAIAERDQPSPFSRIGPGIRGEFKPELVEYGGNLAFDHALHSVRENAGCNIVVATNLVSPPITTSFGTSFAAPKVAHHLSIILDDLVSLGIDPSGALLRAFLISSAQYPRNERFINAVRQLRLNDIDYRNTVGYGIPSADRATYCDDYTIVMYYQGLLEHDKVALFDIPVPANLSETPREPKRLSVTLAFDPEVHHRGFGDYFGTTMQWRLFRGDQDRATVTDLMSAPAEASEDETTVEGVAVQVGGAPRPRLDLPGAHGIQRRSRGTVQHDIERWSDHNREYSRNHYILAVTSFEKWGRTRPEPIPYAVVVKLEEHSRTVPIYGPVSLLLPTTVDVRA